MKTLVSLPAKRVLSVIIEFGILCSIIIPAALILFPPIIRFGSDPALKNSPTESASRIPTKGENWWDNIGGCGVSGGASSGGGASGAKWVGRGVSGGLIDMELDYNMTLGSDYAYRNLAAQLSYPFLSKNRFSVTLPFGLKSGTYLYDKDQPPVYQVVGGFGDMGLGFSRKFGSINALQVTLGTGLPTGKDDHRRYNNLYSPISGVAETELVPPELQTGTGLYNATLGMEYTIDKDWGPIVINGGYTAFFNSPVDLFSMNRGWGAQNHVWDNHISSWGLDPNATYNMTYGDWRNLPQPDFPSNPGDSAAMAAYQAAMDQWRSPHTVSKEYYVRDQDNNRIGKLLGDFYSDVLNISVAAGYKEERCVHSLAVTYSYNLRPSWYVRRLSPDIAAYSVRRLDDYVEEVSIRPVFKEQNRHSFGLSYGLEISSEYFPVFLAGTMILGPSGEIQSWGGTLALKGSFL